MNLTVSKAPWVKLEFPNAAKLIHVEPKAGVHEGDEAAGVHLSVREAGTGKPINMFFSLTDFAKLLVQGRYSFRHAFREASLSERGAVQHFARHEDLMEALVPIRKPGMDTFQLLGIEKE